jgi:hypothetical protein
VRHLMLSRQANGNSQVGRHLDGAGAAAGASSPAHVCLMRIARLVSPVQCEDQRCRLQQSEREFPKPTDKGGPNIQNTKSSSDMLTSADASRICETMRGGKLTKQFAAGT